MGTMDEFSRITGLSKPVINEVWEEVKANHARLDTCTGPHKFVPIDATKVLGRRYVCSLCKGEVDSINRSWYEKGFEHAQNRSAD